MDVVGERNTVQSHNQDFNRNVYHGDYHSSVLLLVLLGSSGVVLVFVPVLVLQQGDRIVITKYVTPFIGIVFAFIVIVMSLVFLVKNGSWQRNREGKRKQTVESSINYVVEDRQIDDDDKDDEVKDEEDDEDAEGDDINETRLPTEVTRFNANCKVRLKPILIFGTGGCIYLIIGIVNSSENMSDDNSLVILYQMMLLMSAVFQIMFFFVYDGAVLINNSVFNYVIAFLIADKVWLWITLTLSALSNIVPGKLSCNKTNGSTDLTEALETAEMFSEPFFIEFLTISVTILFQLWNSMGNASQVEILVDSDNNNVSVTAEAERQDANEHHPLLPAKHDGNPRRVHGCFVVLFILIGLTNCIGELTLFFDPIDRISNGIPDRTKNTILRCIQISLYGPYAIMCFVSTYKIYKKNRLSPNMPKVNSFSGGEYLLLFSTADMFIWGILRVIVTVGCLSDEKKRIKTTEIEMIFMLLYDIVAIIQTWIQTQLILAGHKARRSGHAISDMTKFCFGYLIALSITQWFNESLMRNSILHHDDNAVMPELSAYFGDTTVKFIVYILFPFSLVYKFHCAVMGYEILKGSNVD